MAAKHPLCLKKQSVPMISNQHLPFRAMNVLSCCKHMWITCLWPDLM
jgi:hypothetical protein